jgi:hypothetical protein
MIKEVDNLYTGRHSVEHRLHLTRVRAVQPEVWTAIIVTSLSHSVRTLQMEVLAQVRLIFGVKGSSPRRWNRWQPLSATRI